MRVARPLVGLIDQGLSSASNLGVTIAVATVASPQRFGAFGLAMTFYLLVITINKGVTGGVASIRISHLSGADFQSEASAAASAAITVGTFAAVISAAAAVFLLPEDVANLLLVVAIGLPVLAIQDTLRHLAYAADRPWAAAFNSAGWLGFQTTVFTVLFLTSSATATALTAAWVATSIAGATVGLVWLRLTVTSPGPRAWFTTHGRWIRGLMAEHTLIAGVAQGAPLVIAWTAGLESIGSLRGAITLFGPLTMAGHGLMMAITPSTARAWHRRETRYSRKLLLTGSVLGVASALWGIAVATAPNSWGTQILGETWPGASAIAVGVGIWLALGYLAEPAIVLLRVTGRTATPARLRLVLAPTTLGLTWLGATFAGTTGALGGLTLAAALALIGFWIAWWHSKPAAGSTAPSV